MNYPHPILAREGWPFIAGSLLLAGLASSYGLVSLPLWIVFLFCVQFFRDPARVVAGGEKSIVAPADGRIVVVEEADDPYLNRRALKISVFMNVFNVHSNRAPVASRVQEKWYKPGSFFNAALAKASLENERCALHLKTADGRDVTCVQIAGPDRPPHPQLRDCRQGTRRRRTLRLHPFRFPCRRVPAARQPGQGRHRRESLRLEHDPRRTRLSTAGQRSRMPSRLRSLIRFACRVWRRYVDEEFYQVNGSLAYTTLLSLVPLVAIVLGIVSMLPFFPGIVRELDVLIAQTFLPERNAGVIVGHIIAFSQAGGQRPRWPASPASSPPCLFLLLSV